MLGLLRQKAWSVPGDLLRHVFYTATASMSNCPSLLVLLASASPQAAVGPQLEPQTDPVCAPSICIESDHLQLHVEKLLKPSWKLKAILTRPCQSLIFNLSHEAEELFTSQS